jgi:hypothetical protein
MTSVKPTRLLYMPSRHPQTATHFSHPFLSGERRGFLTDTRILAAEICAAEHPWLWRDILCSGTEMTQGPKLAVPGDASRHHRTYSGIPSVEFQAAVQTHNSVIAT